MHLTLSDYVLWSFTTLLEIVLCTLIVRYRSYRVVPFFSAYLFFATARALSLWWIYQDSSLDPHLVFKFYWATQLVLVAGRGLEASRVGRAVVRSRPAVRGLG